MKTLFEQHQQWCVHYKREPGMPKREACKAGVVYDDLARVSELGRVGCMARLPCIRDHHDPTERRGQPLCACPHLRFPTQEESRKHERETDAHIAKMMVAFAEADRIRTEHKGKNWNGVIECPVCKRRLHIEHVAYNGHTRGKCETENCAAWIE